MPWFTYHLGTSKEPSSDPEQSKDFGTVGIESHREAFGCSRFGEVI